MGKSNQFFGILIWFWLFITVVIGLKLADCIISLGKIFIMDYIWCWAIVVAIVYPVAMAVVGQ